MALAFGELGAGYKDPCAMMRLDGSVWLRGYGTVLRNGAIEGCPSGGCTFTPMVAAFDAGEHRMETLRLQWTVGDGIALLSPRNHVYACDILADIGISGDQNRVDQTTVAAEDTGISVGGRFNKITRNLVQSAVEGYVVSGEQNILIANVATQGIVGLHVLGVGNLVLANTAEPNTISDAIDDSGTCTTNWWILNHYETADPACLLEPPHRVDSTTSGMRMPDK
jgi:hypothetical protein